MSVTNKKEEEITVFARVGDFNGFKNADGVANIQELSTLIPGRGKYRARKITDGNGTIFTANVKSEGSGDVVRTSLDEEAPVTAAYFEAARTLADRLIVRDRFVFNGSTASLVVGGKEVLLPAIDFQVDVFHRFDGRESEWVKIDIEVERLLAALRSMGKDVNAMDLTIKVSHLPFKPQQAFIVSSENSPEELSLIKKIWDEYSQSPNGGPVQEIDSSIREKQNIPPVTQSSEQQPESEGNNDGENNV